MLFYCQHLQRIFYSWVCGSIYETQKVQQVHIKIHVKYEMKVLLERYMMLVQYKTTNLSSLFAVRIIEYDYFMLKVYKTPSSH